MIKALCDTDKGPLVMLGLSHMNLQKLKEGMPIEVDLKEMGLQGRVVIFAGETELKMKEDLAQFIGPRTKVSIDPKLKP